MTWTVSDCPCDGTTLCATCHGPGDDEDTNMTTPADSPTIPTTYRTEFALDGQWYTNALRFDSVTEAVNEASSRFSRWTLPAAWRVVTDDVPVKQPFGGSVDPTAFRVTDATGQQVAGLTA